ncbi:29972_t:CDS:2, partial [Racocetra persica]
NLKVTDSLRLKENIIIKSILNKFKLRHYTKRRRVEESAASSPSPDIISKSKIGLQSYNSGHDFESVIRKIAEASSLLANEIKVTQGDNDIDIIITYKEKLILIQCKNWKTPINVQIVRIFESAISRFPSDSLGIIVYNSEKMGEKIVTPKAKRWAFTSKKNIEICDKNQFVKIIKDFYDLDEDDHIELIDYKANYFDIINLIGENVDYIILDHTQKDMKMFNKFFQDPSEKEYIDRKVDVIEPFNFYKVVFVTVPIKMSIERQQKRACLGELVDREYLETLNAYYLEDIDLVYSENLKFENIVNLCGDDCAQCLGVKIYENFFNTLL